MDGTKRFIAVLIVLFVGVAIGFAGGRVFQDEQPVRYRWQVSGKPQCAVVLPGGERKYCSAYSAQELNAFRLEWACPKDHHIVSNDSRRCREFSSSGLFRTGREA